MRLPRLAIENFQFTLIFFVLLTLTGFMSLFTMPRSEDPQVANPGASVVVVYPGTNPEDMERLVVSPIEDALNELDDIKKLISSAENDLAMITIEFTFGEDPDEKYSDVVQKINSMRNDLPDDILSIDINKFSLSDFVNIFQIALISDSSDYAALDREATFLQGELEKINGIKKSEIFANPEREVRISVNLQKLASMNISLNEVIGSVQSSNANIPGGNIDIGSRRFNITTSGPYQSLEEIRHTIVRSSNHHLVYLKDVADVNFAYKEMSHFARFKGKTAIFVTGTQKEKTNIFNIMGKVHQTVHSYMENKPQNIELSWVFDQSNSVSQRVNSFFLNLLQGIVLVGLVMMLVLGVRASLIVMIVIPISLLIGIGALDFSRFGIQQMSITGLVIALGLLVDNAIVVTENVSRFTKLGYAFKDAAIAGTQQISWAIVSSTATTILAFLPIIFMQDTSGDFIRSMPLTVVYTLIASLLVSLSLTPFMASRFLKKNIHARSTRGQTLIEMFVRKVYNGQLNFALSHPKVTLFAAAFVFVASLALFPLIGVSFFPKAEKAQFMINISLPKGTNIDKTDEIAWMVENKLSEKPQVKHFTSNIGKGNPVVYYNILMMSQATNKAQLYVTLHDEALDEMDGLLADLREEFGNIPNTRIEIKEFTQGPPVEAPIAIRVIGDQLVILEEIVGEVEGLMMNTPGVINVYNPLATPKTELHVKINREKAGMLGLNLADIDRTVRMSIAGLILAKYRDAIGDEYDIVLRLPAGSEPQVDDLDRIYLTSATGAQVPLRLVANLSFQTRPAMISHYAKDRAFVVTADVATGMSVDEATRAIMAELDHYDWPKGYRYSVGGELESREESFGGMVQAILIAMIAIFGVLVLQFRSFTQPLIVFTAIPLAIIGSLWALLITGNNFSFTAFVGLTSLVGIVVNNSIILVDYTNQLRRAGWEQLEALKEAGQTRFLPIILTTGTTIGGLLPLTLQGGTMWAPMGWTIIGGLIASTILTLLVVPVLYNFYTSEKAFENELTEGDSEKGLLESGDSGGPALAS
ncbi:efflux RND transporter permease subunit [candidate division KSB1 bacterium]|nr:efflux RND transporter permease subunit [candidate division KSB1 bacterium]